MLTLQHTYLKDTRHSRRATRGLPPALLCERPESINNFPDNMINNTISDRNILNRPCTVHFSKQDAADRNEIEQFIRKIFYQACGARVRFFLPTLMSLRDKDGKLIAACGIRNAGAEPLFLENYTDKPVEQLLSEREGVIVQRSDLVEIGNYSVSEMGLSRLLISAIFDQLHATSKQWAVFTAIQLVRNALIKQNIFPRILCDADISRLPPEDQSEWGSYYEQKPQVMAIRRMERRRERRSQPA